MSDLKIGFIGLGNMGMPMAKCLVINRFPLTAYDIRQESLDEIKSLGATISKTCREVAAASDVIISMVRDIPQTDDVIFGKDGLWEGLKEGMTIIISSSIGPRYCRNLYEKAKDLGVQVIDCGVSDPTLTRHELGKLTLMIGGDEDAVRHCWPIFEALGENIFHVGDIGNGQAYKLVNNIAARYMGIINRVFLIECLNLGLEVGLDLQKMIDVLSVSAGARMLQNMGLRQGLSSKQIFEILSVPMTVISSPQQHRVNELDYAREMAEEFGVKIPICQFIENFDVSTQYDKYFSLLKRS
jgi:3-hydroxyisobutyrate dehydrogenase